MTYELFKSELLKTLQKLDSKHSYQIIPQTKAGSQELLHCERLRAGKSPALDVMGLYQEAENLDLDFVRDIAEMFSSNIQLIEFMEDPDKTFEDVKETICCRLVNPTQKAEMLNHAVHTPYLDLEVLFYLDFGKFAREMGINCLIAQGSLERWNLSMEDLYKIAKENTMRLHPPKIYSVTQLAEDLSRECETVLFKELAAEIQDKGHCFQVTNEEHYLGATSLLYPEVFEAIAQEERQDLFLTLLSEDEITVEPAVGNPSALQAILQGFCELSSSQTLSNQIYCYRKGSAQISLCLNADRMR